MAPAGNPNTWDSSIDSLGTKLLVNDSRVLSPHPVHSPSVFSCPSLKWTGTWRSALPFRSAMEVRASTQTRLCTSLRLISIVSCLPSAETPFNSQIKTFMKNKMFNMYLLTYDGIITDHFFYF